MKLPPTRAKSLNDILDSICRGATHQREVIRQLREFADSLSGDEKAFAHEWVSKQ